MRKIKMNAKRKSIKEKERHMIYKKYHGICQLCGRTITYEEMTVDHIIPLGMGGRNQLSNYQCTCRTCNKMKGTMLQDEFYLQVTETFWYLTEKKCGKEFSEQLQQLIERNS